MREREDTERYHAVLDRSINFLAANRGPILLPSTGRVKD